MSNFATATMDQSVVFWRTVEAGEGTMVLQGPWGTVEAKEDDILMTTPSGRFFVFDQQTFTDLTGIIP